MIISSSQCWTCCAKQFNACPLIEDHSAVLKGRNRQEKSTSPALLSVSQWIRVIRKMQIRPLAGQLPCCSPGSSVCRMAKEPCWTSELLLPELRRAPFLPQGHHLPCGEVTIPIQRERTKTQSPFLALKPPPTSTLHSPVLVQRWVKSQGNKHNALPVVK